MRAIFLAGLWAGNAAGEVLPPPVRSMAAPADFSYQPVPRFGHGYLAAIDSTRTRVRTWDRDGAPKADAALSVPNGGQTIVHDVAVAADGSFAVAATLTGASASILWCSAAGEVRRVQPTGSFSARRIASNGAAISGRRAGIRRTRTRKPFAPTETRANCDGSPYLRPAARVSLAKFSYRCEPIGFR
jgi:hypothetical protein